MRAGHGTGYTLTEQPDKTVEFAGAPMSIQVETGVETYRGVPRTDNGVAVAACCCGLWRACVRRRRPA